MNWFWQLFNWKPNATTAPQKPRTELETLVIEYTTAVRELKELRVRETEAYHRKWEAERRMEELASRDAGS